MNPIPEPHKPAEKFIKTAMVILILGWTGAIAATTAFFLLRWIWRALS